MPRRLQPDRSARRPPSTCFCVEGASHPKNPVGGLRLKAAVHHLTRALAQRMAAQNVTVNSIAPGPFMSRMMATTLEELGDQWRANCPLGRLGEPDDMAGIAVYLASRAGAYVTGQIIAVDGGFSTRPW